MKITIKKALEMTDPLQSYIDEKLVPLAKFIKPFEKDGEAELHLEISRTSNHHHKGEEIFMAIADLRLAGKTLRADASSSDIRKAIDEVRGILHLEIEKFKTKHPKVKREEK